jgi:protease PrsW
MFSTYISFIEKYPFTLSFLLGLIPALAWLWFWLKEDIHPEPAKMITLSFLGGMVAVVLVLPIQQLVLNYFAGQTNLQFFLWAALEELFKFGVVYWIALKRSVTDEPVDCIIYMIVCALGFGALENTFFLFGLVHSGDFFGAFITGNMRFIGAGLLHIISSGTVGICLALAFYKSKTKKYLYTIIGIIIAVILHTSFNIYIMNSATSNIFLIFGAVWVGVVGLLLLFEKVKNL